MINERQYRRMMRKMGIKQEEMDVEEVILKMRDGRVFRVRSPSVMKVEAKGQSTLMVMGEIEEVSEGGDSFPEEDIALVMEQTGCTREEAIQALKEADGEPAEAIISLMSRK